MPLARESLRCHVKMKVFDRFALELMLSSLLCYDAKHLQNDKYLKSFYFTKCFFVMQGFMMKCSMWFKSRGIVFDPVQKKFFDQQPH